MNWKAIIVVFVVLFLTGLALRPVGGPAWEELKAREPALALEDLEAALGQGITIGMLGGFRAVVADLLWIRTNAVWEAQEPAVIPATETLIRLVTTVDPRPEYFWLNGARMIAYDMSVWRVRAAGGYEVVPESVVRRYHDEQAENAIRLLRRGHEFHPERAAILVDIANIYLRRKEDVEMAAEYYRRASEVPEPPPYAARIYAELLRRLGEDEAAYRWLVDLYPTLNPRDLTHQTERVLSRIRELEGELDIPFPERFQP